MIGPDKCMSDDQATAAVRMLSNIIVLYQHLIPAFLVNQAGD
jgi:hypothetical protein